MLLTLLADTPATDPQYIQGLPPEDSTDGLMHLLHIIGDFYRNGIDDHLIVAGLSFVILIMNTNLTNFVEDWLVM